MFVWEFNAVALVTLVILWLTSVMGSKKKDRTNKLFNLIIILVLLSTVCDLSTGLIIRLMGNCHLKKVLLYVLNYAYFVFHSNILTIYFLYCFSTMGIWYILKKKRWIQIYIGVFTIIQNLMVIVSLNTNIIFYIDENMNYKRSNGIYIIYIASFFIMLLGTVILLVYKRLVRWDKFIVMISMVPINIIAIIIQGLNSNLPVELFTISCELIIFIIVVQRDEGYIDPISGAKKYNAGVETLKRILYTDTPVSIILIKFANNKNLRAFLGRYKYEAFLREVTGCVDSVAKGMFSNYGTYYLEYGLFALMVVEEDEELILKAAKKIRKMCENDLVSHEYNHEIYLDTRFCIVNCPEDVSDYSVLLTFGITYHKTLPETREILFYRDYMEKKEFRIKNELSNIITRCIEEKNYEIYYKPVFSLETKKCVSADTIICLHDEEYGDISPDVFMHEAERNGFMSEIGKYILEETFNFIQTYKWSNIGIEKIHIRLYFSQCIENDFADKVQEISAKYDVNPEMICFGIIEDEDEDGEKTVIKNIEELKKCGYAISLDKYGVGYSNLKNVTKLPIDVIQLANDFSKNIDNTEMEIVISDTIRMFKDMGKRISVEYSGDLTSIDIFKELGCSTIMSYDGANVCDRQDWFVSKPLSSYEFIKFVEKVNGINN